MTFSKVATLIHIFVHVFQRQHCFVPHLPFLQVGYGLFHALLLKLSQLHDLTIWSHAAQYLTFTGLSSFIYSADDNNDNIMITITMRIW